MFYSMGHARHAYLVTEVSNVDVHRRTRLVRLRIMDEQDLEPVRQPNDAVGTIVQRRGFQLIRYPFRRLSCPHLS